jgi:acyl-CoA reductase-like NAD-dependent aldehyde dehydrogenase
VVLLAGIDHNVIDPTLIRKVDPSLRISCQEVFGPIAVLDTFDTFDEALFKVNDSRFGLQAGLFTHDIDHAFRAFQELEVGGITVNETPSWRVDHMPYGGVKDSGFGREGIRYAIEEMTEPRLMVLNLG